MSHTNIVTSSTLPFHLFPSNPFSHPKSLFFLRFQQGAQDAHAAVGPQQARVRTTHQLEHHMMKRRSKLWENWYDRDVNAVLVRHFIFHFFFCLLLLSHFFFWFSQLLSTDQSQQHLLVIAAAVTLKEKKGEKQLLCERGVLLWFYRVYLLQHFL